MKPTEKVAAVITIGVIAIIIAVALAPTIRSAPQQSCANNLKTLSLALSAYCEDTEMHLPPADGWANALVPRYLETPGSAVCPAARPTAEQVAAYQGAARRLPVGYALFRPMAVADARLLNEPEKTPLVFDATVFGPGATGDLSVLDTARHPGGAMIAYADQHIEPSTAAPQLPARLFLSPQEFEAEAKAAAASECSR